MTTIFMEDENNIKQFSIETASINDLPHILSLQKQAFKSEAERYNDFTIPPMTQTIEELKDEHCSTLILKSTLNGVIIGSVRASLDENNVCHIGRLVVLPSHQGKGVGTALMHSIEKRFSNCNYFQIFTGINSHQTIKLYKNLGYKIKHNKQQSDSILVIMTKFNKK